MVAGYTLKEIMEYMGHSNLAMVQRYVKLLPQPEETDPAERLNAYLPAGRPADINRARVSTFVSTQRRRMLVL